MLLAEFEALWRVGEKDAIVSADSLGDRTLLWGYDVERRSWHVYQKDGELHLLVWGGLSQDAEPDVYVSGPSFPAKDLAPNKRLYPERCDFTFCVAMKNAGAYLSFTTWNESAAVQNKGNKFYAPTREDFPAATLLIP